MSLYETSSTPVTQSNARHWPIIICLTLFAALIFLGRLHTYSEAMERDIAGYAVIAHEMLHGRALYSDLWERKPPLLYATFAAAQFVCGYGLGQIFLLNISAAIVTLIALFFAGKGLTGSKIAGLFAAGFWMLISGDLYVQANQPNAEVFVNACLTTAVALLAHPPAFRNVRFALLLGFLLVSATLYKQHVVITCALLSAAYLFGSADRSRFRSRLLDMTIAGSVLLCSWATVAGYFAVSGRFAFFFDTLFRQNVSYSGNVGRNILVAFLPANLFPTFASCIYPILSLICLAILARAKLYFQDKKILDRRTEGMEKTKAKSLPVLRDLCVFATKPGASLWIAWAVGSAITFALPGKFFMHYYQLWLPVWCVAGGWAATRLLNELRPGYRIVNRLLVGAVLGCMIGSQISQMLLPTDEWTRRKYPTDDFVQERKMGLQLAKLLSAGKSFYNLGEDTPLYLYSGHPPASGLLYLGPLETGNDIDAYERRLLADLNRSKPDLIVVSTLRYTTLRKRPAFAGWIKQHYSPVEQTLGCPIYRLMVNIDSPLAQRLEPTSQNQVATLHERD